MNVGENPVVTQHFQGLCEAENVSTEGPQGPDEPDRSHGRWRAAMRVQSGFHEALEIGKHVPKQITGHSLVSIPKTEQCKVVFSCNLEGAGKQPAWPAEARIFPRPERSGGL